MAKAPNWSQEELDMLYELYPEFGSCDELLEFLPLRTKKSITLKASRLGLKVSNPWNKKRSDEEYSKLAKDRGCIVLDPYINDRTEILHQCLKCENKWRIRPNNLVNDHGCPVCNKGFGSLFSSNGKMPEQATLYVIAIELHDGELFIKVGVTIFNAARRIAEINRALRPHVKSITIIDELIGTGEYILKLENTILKDSLVNKYHIQHEFKGKTELLALDSLNRIKEIINNGLI